MKRFTGSLVMVTAMLLLPASFGFAQSVGDRSSIGEEKPLSETVKDDQEQAPAMKLKKQANDTQDYDNKRFTQKPDSAPLNDRH